jgi:RimJ/RimL family protein N-acetyltransferase
MCVIERTPRIETRRLTLRAPAPGDAPALAGLIGDFDVARMTSRMPHPYAIEDAEDFIVRCQGLDPRADCHFLLEHDDHGVVGGLSFTTPAGEPSEVGYWIGKPWWGRGLATEALSESLVWASREWGRRFVVAGHYADNPASGAVLCKAGFLYTGETQWRHSRARDEEVATRMMVWVA